MRSFTILAFFAFHSFVFANDQVFDPERLSKITLLSDLNRPMELEVAPDGRIFFIELDGAFKVLNSKSKEVTEIRKFEVARKGEVGLIGLALDPAFQKNNWVYLQYSPIGLTSQRTSRFTLDGNKIVEGSEKISVSYTHLRAHET